MGCLIYQLPNQEIKSFQGNWISSSLKNLPDDVFFITDFTKEEVFYFEGISKGNIDDLVLSSNADEEVFAVDGRYYLNGLQHFIDGFDDYGIEKAIYSRIKLAKRGRTSPIEIFKKIASKYQQQALVYLVSDEVFGTWLGATPEILLSGDKEQLESMALAGTKSKVDQQWTDKEIEEHQFVIDFIKEQIESQNPESLNIAETKTVHAGEVFHLRTDFRFQISSDKWNSLIDSLHPTPAVCGTPMKNAKEYILKFEPHDRKFYTGLLGWKGKDRLDIYVNLRCMQVLENYYALYVGGGITKVSRLEDEWRETEHKSETLLTLISNED
ncbi:MAG: chorismate-binding protein [Brumimicrobium sp.]